MNNDLEIIVMHRAVESGIKLGMQISFPSQHMTKIVCNLLISKHHSWIVNNLINFLQDISYFDPYT